MCRYQPCTCTRWSHPAWDRRQPPIQHKSCASQSCTTTHPRKLPAPAKRVPQACMDSDYRTQTPFPMQVAGLAGGASVYLWEGGPDEFGTTAMIQLPAKFVVLLIRGYQLCISPLLPPMCRFTPSCSQYAVEALRRFGFFKGTAMALWRICRCHPFNPGGYDPVPMRHDPNTDTEEANVHNHE